MFDTELSMNLINGPTTLKINRNDISDPVKSFYKSCINYYKNVSKFSWFFRKLEHSLFFFHFEWKT